MKPLHKKVVTVFFATVAGLYFAELVARWTYGEGFEMLVDSYVDHTYRPYLEYDQLWAGRRVHFHTNSLGWKDTRPRRVEKLPSSPRIVFLGDSFTEGLGLSSGHTLPSVVERWLVSRGEKVEVLNGGRASFSPILEYQRLKRFLEEGYRTDVLVVLFDLSDVQDELLYKARYEFSAAGEPLRLRGWRNQPTLRGIYNRSALVRSLSRLGHLLDGSLPPSPGNPTMDRAAVVPDLRPDGPSIPSQRLLSMPPLAFWVLRSNWIVHRPSLDGWVEEGFHLGFGHLDRLNALAKANGIRLLIVIYPWPQMLYTQKDPGTYAILKRNFREIFDDRELVTGTQPSPRVSEYQTRVRDFCHNRDIPLLDLVPAFQQIPDWYRLYLPGDVHLNEQGSRFAGSRIAHEVSHLLYNR